MSETPSIAIVGAGLAGLMAARTLRAEGIPTRVFEKSRAPGGRAATRHAAPYAFDHGAQYFTQRDLRTQTLLEEWVAAGVAARWEAQIAVHDSAGWRSESRAVERWVGVPGMRALGEHLAEVEDVVYGTRVASLRRHDDHWELLDEAGQALGSFSQVLVCIPAAQAQALLHPHAPSFGAALTTFRMLPCVAAMVVFERRPEVPWDAAFVNEHPVLSWIARNASKPGRSGGESWVLHASPEWSAEHLEQAPATLLPELLAAGATLLGAPPVLHATAHRWRYAIPQPEETGGATAVPRVPALFDETLGLGAAGDWCAGGRVEGALLSGMAAAQYLL